MVDVKVECPRCRKMLNWEGNPFRPFCSLECKRDDLGRWANEEYRISEEADTGEDERPAKELNETGKEE